MRLMLTTLLLVSLGFAATDAQARELPNFDLATAAAPVRPLPVPDGVAVARAPGRGAPSLLWTPLAAPAPASLSLEAAARLHLGRHAASYGVSKDALAGARMLYTHDTGRGGMIVALRQTAAGVDLFHADVKLLLDRSRRLVAIAGTPHPAALASQAPAFARAPEDAIAAALRDLYGELGAATVVATEARAGWRHYALAQGGRVRFYEPARVRPVYFPLGDSLVPAHVVELQTSLGVGRDVYQYIVAADDGRLLYRRDATAYDAAKYRAWADPDGDKRPLDGPLLDHNPHPTGVPDRGPTAFAEPPLVTMEGFNTGPGGEADPWLPAGAAITRGNNVDAYIDPNGSNPTSNKQRAESTAPGVFDHAYDPLLDPRATESQWMAVLVNAFYLANWQHDWWYDSGFTEATGNGQMDNYGRGGADADPMYIEAQDGALTDARNNASMSTPADGLPGRMEVLLFEPGATAELALTPLNQEFPARAAGFGPAEFDLGGPLVQVVDAGGVTPSDGCDLPLADLSGEIAVIDRGLCSLEEKVANAEAAGAIAVVLVDSADNLAPPFAVGVDEVVDPTIPSVTTTAAAGDAIKAALKSGDMTAHLAGAPSPERDGALGNMLLAHEWGHFLHHRLAESGSNQGRAESEGWGDFNALLMSLREGDDLDGAYVFSPYASIDATGYFGFRRMPFSTDPAINALSFRHIADGEPLPADNAIEPKPSYNSEVHNAGEIWALMLWESYTALHKAHAGDLSFAEVHRRMSDYVVAGLMLAPPDVTYTEQRDALLMAVAAADPGDLETFAGGFARRGAGTCAVSPPRWSEDFEGVQEDFELRARGVPLAARIGDALKSCDDDGVLDAGELGEIEVDVFNSGLAPLPAGTLLEVVGPDPALVFPEGPSVELPELAPLAKTTVALTVALAEDISAPQAFALRLRVGAGPGCEAPGELVLRGQVDADLATGAATSDDFEVAATPWTIQGEQADLAWARVGVPSGHIWRGTNLPGVSDTSLVSPPFEVSKDEDVTISFDHAYSFDQYNDWPWDGGVIELSNDDGETWHDLAEITGDTGYNGVINSQGNPLAKRPGFVRQSSNFPERKPYSVDLGKKLAGQTMRLRFRIGTNGVNSAAGWDIDNLSITGLVASPFPRWVADASECSPAVDTTGGSEGGEEPTTGVEPDPSGGSEGSSGGSDGGPGVDDASVGCNCAADAGGGALAQALPWLSLLGLRRRRRA